MSLVESIYSRLGGESVLREFVDKLYGYMDVMPEVRHIRNMHSNDLSHTSDRVFMFLSGMLGGPPLYMEAFGHPRLRRKHMHFEIGNEERDQWLMCAHHAADQLDVSASVRDELMAELGAMANHLRNKDDNVQQCMVTNAGSNTRVNMGHDD